MWAAKSLVYLKEFSVDTRPTREPLSLFVGREPSSAVLVAILVRAVPGGTPSTPRGKCTHLHPYIPCRILPVNAVELLGALTEYIVSFPYQITNWTLTRVVSDRALSLRAREGTCNSD